MWNRNAAEYSALLQRNRLPSYDALGFDASYFETLCELMGAETSNIDLDAFEQDHFNVLFGYLQAKQLEEETPSITNETAALSKVQRQARKLAG